MSLINSSRDDERVMMKLNWKVSSHTSPSAIDRLTLFSSQTSRHFRANLKMSPISAVFLVVFTLNFLSNEPAGVNGAPSCHVFCTFEFNPICGTDGQTYSNPCSLNAKNQCDGTAISKAYNGRCTTAATTPCPSEACTLEYAPVCGTDGKTYSNACQLRAACGRAVTVSIAHDGLCRSGDGNGVTCTADDEIPLVCGCPCAIRCSNEYIPLCGTDGKTYTNPCQLAVANSCAENPVRKCYDGECRY